MARRKHSGEISIGSDSFLDVICNIVGILIILIVIAGIRVARAPVTADSGPEPSQVEPEDSVKQSAIERPVPPDLLPPLDDLEPLEPEFVAQEQPAPEVETRRRALRIDAERLRTQLQEVIAARQDLEQQQARGELQVAEGRDQLLSEKSKRESRARSIEEYRSLIVSQQQSLTALQQTVAELEKEAPPSQGIKHRVTPLSRTVVGEQHHFRLSGNRVSQVPIYDLLSAAMRQAKRHADSIAVKRSHTGTVGPSGGYFLQYKLEAVPPSAVDAARFGPGMFRVSMSSFQIQPDTDLRDETADEALTRGSLFDIAVQTADPGATFTLWVYPDSFELYRQLQARLHDSGFTVAARPLPVGVPIAGSPDGSASAGQ